MALNFRRQHRRQMARVEQMRTVIGDGEFLNALDRACVLNGDGCVIADDIEESDGVISQGLGRDVGHQQDAQCAFARAQWQANGGGLLIAAGERCGVAFPRYDERFTMQSHQLSG